MLDINSLPETRHFERINEIIAFYPVSKPGQGIFTLVLFPETAVLSRRSVKNILLLLAREAAVDIVAARKKAGRITGKRHEVPLPLEPGKIFVPLRAFQPLPGCEGSLGYFSLEAIKEIQPGHQPGFSSRLFFGTGYQVELIPAPATVERQLALSRLLQSEYWGARNSFTSPGAATCSHIGESSVSYLPLILAELARLNLRQ